jgi:hypothetical protein
MGRQLNYSYAGLQILVNPNLQLFGRTGTWVELLHELQIFSNTLEEEPVLLLQKVDVDVARLVVGEPDDLEPVQ